MAQTVKNMPAMWETQVQSLSQEDSLEKEMATHSNILAWRIPWTEKPGGLQTTGFQRVGYDWHFHFHFFLYDSQLLQKYHLFWMVGTEKVRYLLLMP